MAEIITSKGVKILVDTDDLWVAGHSWSILKTKNSDLNYAKTNILGRTTTMHRLILGVPQGMHVDHINGNGLDNRRENLRVCTAQQNLRNQRHNPNGRVSSPYKGVWKCSRARWAAQLGISGRTVYLGTFPTPEAAALAYNEAALKHFGRFALLNQIPA